MSQVSLEELSPFAQEYARAYGQNDQRFVILPNNPPITATNPVRLASQRGRDMNHFLLLAQPEPHRGLEGIIAENFVKIALNHHLEQGGFQATLAPHSIEHGFGQKGVDILITDKPTSDDQDPLIYMGIDVKLRQGVRHHPDQYGWEDRIKSPWMYLSLEAWDTLTDTGERVTIKKWLNKFSAPSIRGRQQIPFANDFRNFLFRRIERGLDGLREYTVQPEVFPGRPDMPNSGSDLTILRLKVNMMQELFTTIATNT